MLIKIETTEGNFEYINKAHVSKVYGLNKTGNPRINMLDGSYTVTAMKIEDLVGLLNEDL